VAESDPPGKAIGQFNWTYDWGSGGNTYQDNDTDDDDRSVWYGRMVEGGELSCSAVVAGVDCTDTMSITITPRDWTTPISCAQDNESGYGEVPIATAELGQNRDRDSDIHDHLFVPRNPGDDFSPAYTVAQVPYGPCQGLYYVSSSTLKCQRETVINRYIKSLGPKPLGATYNFYDRNDLDCLDANAFVQALKNHEYRGTPAVYKSEEGHQGRIEKSIVDHGNDPKAALESITHTVQSSLHALVQAAILDAEFEVEEFGLDETYMDIHGPNWGLGSGALGVGGHKRWDDSAGSWSSSCNNGPTSF
jgi:hypothetical protein